MHLNFNKIKNIVVDNIIVTFKLGDKAKTKEDVGVNYTAYFI